MSHGLGRTKQPRSWSARKARRFSAMLGITLSYVTLRCPLPLWEMSGEARGADPGEGSFWLIHEHPSPGPLLSSFSLRHPHASTSAFSHLVQPECSNLA